MILILCFNSIEKKNERIHIDSIHRYHDIQQFIFQTYKDAYDTIEVYDPQSKRFIDSSESWSHESYKYLMIYLSSSTTSNSDSLQILGPLYQLKELSIAGCAITLMSKQGVDFDIDGNTGLTSWDGAIVLSKYFERHPFLVQNKTILELGSGTGIGAISVLKLGCRFVACTDLPYTLDQLTRNLETHLHHDNTFKVFALDWTDANTYPAPFLHKYNMCSDNSNSVVEDRWDVIMGADVVWLDHLVRPLIETLVALCGELTDIYISYQVQMRYYFTIIYHHYHLIGCI
jgi:hypothetical protein